MGQVQLAAAQEFEGLTLPGRTAIRSDRRSLAVPRWIKNLHITEEGHLWMPSASYSEIHDFGVSHAPIRQIIVANRPRGLVIQTSQAIFWKKLNDNFTDAGEAPVLIATPTDPNWPIWVNSTVDYFLVGYAGRGETVVGQTWKVEAGSPITVTTPSGQPLSGRASFSQLYKGRRFVVERGRQVWFSDLNEHTTFSEDNTFTISGDDAGTNKQDDPGVVYGMMSWEDVLVFFLTQSVWILVGSTPQTFQLRQVQMPMGNLAPWSIVKALNGIYFIGGRHFGDQGVYRFTGSSAQKVSESIESKFRTPNDISYGVTSAMFSNRYIIANPHESWADEPLMLHSLDSGRWTQFGGYDSPVVGTGARYLYLSDSGRILQTSASPIVPRYSGEDSVITLGWEDEGHPTGQVRFMGVKINGKKTGTGIPTIEITSRVTNGSSVQVTSSDPIDIPEDTFKGLLLPINLRGHAIEFDLTITPTEDNQNVLIESLSLVYSRKGEKLSRV